MYKEGGFCKLFFQEACKVGYSWERKWLMVRGRNLTEGRALGGGEELQCDAAWPGMGLMWAGEFVECVR